MRGFGCIQSGDCFQARLPSRPASRRIAQPVCCGQSAGAGHRGNWVCRARSCLRSFTGCWSPSNIKARVCSSWAAATVRWRRRPVFPNCKRPRSRCRIAALLGSNVQQIAKDSVVVDLHGTPMELRNDAVIVSAGGVLPTEFLKSVGIEVATKYGTA
jgi:hypothetical protein